MAPRNTGVVGDAFAAIQAGSLANLYGQQRQAVAGIIEAVHAIAAQSGLKEGVAPLAGGAAPQLRGRVGSDPNDFRRPHHAFVIDGRRGSGKTTALLTLIPYLELLRFGPGDEALTGAERRMSDEPAALDLQGPAHRRIGRRVALVLPVVFTEDLEAQESTMEAVFALLEQELDHQCRHADERRRERLEALRTTLRREVGVSWTYSRKIGVEALSNDSLDYEDFVDKRASLNAKSYTKVIAWRRFLDDLLDVLGYEVLVLVFDDSDLNPAVAEDIIRSMRMYFTHPRAVSIIAVDMETLRLSLTIRNLSATASARSADPKLRSLQDRAGELDERNVVALLDKVLPQPNRHRLGLGDMKHVDYFFRDESSEGAFDQFCRRNSQAANGDHDRLSWWLMDRTYRRLLAGDLRGMIAFKSTVDAAPGSSALATLFENSAFAGLADLVGHDLSALRQLVAAGEFEEGLEDLGEGEKRFIDFWMDTQIAGGTPAASENLAGLRWLAEQETLASQRRALDDEAGAFGLAGALRAELLPRNCIYLYQLRRLQKVLQEDLPRPSDLSTGLAALAQGDLDGHVERALRDLEEDRALGVMPPSEMLSFARTVLLQLVRPQRAMVEEGYGQDFDEAEPDEMLPGRVAAFAILLAAIAEGGAAPSFDAESGKAMAQRLADTVPAAERLRQEALFAWLCANDLAGVGDDGSTLTPRQARRDIVDRATFTSPSQHRLLGLVRTSRERVDADERHGLLLAWSIVPLLGPMHDFGSDYPSTRGSTSTAWNELRALMEKAARPFGIDRNASEDAWRYADMDAERLAGIVADVKRAADAKTHSSETAAGQAVGPDFWTLPPSRRVAAILGVSPSWVEKHLGVQA